MISGTNTALLTFFVLHDSRFLLAILSNRVAKGKEFVGEYFLGSRSFGVWAFALTFAATNASGGTFMGFPALIYTHGWSLALWIAGYMALPLVSMAILGKANQSDRAAIRSVDDTGSFKGSIPQRADWPCRHIHVDLLHVLLHRCSVQGRREDPHDTPCRRPDLSIGSARCRSVGRADTLG